MKRPTAEEIKAYQQETGEGMLWCKAELTKQAALEAVRHLPAQDSNEFRSELQEILTYIIGRLK